jgi:exodeoxyribonuclease-3
MRIVSWNVENLAPYLERDAPMSVPELAARLENPDVLCLQEVRIRADDAELVARMRSALPGFDCHCSLNADARNARYRGGRAYGVATYTRAGLRARTLVFPWDREGRLVVAGIGKFKLAIGNVYAVNGTAKPYFDPDTGLESGDRHRFKRGFIDLFQREAQALRNAGLRLVLIGDWNVSRAKIDVTPRLRTEAPHAAARAQINDRFMPALDLVDVFRERNADARRYTWISRRRTHRLDAARVDYALLQRPLLAGVKSSGIAEEPPHGGSDHLPLWVELDP